MKFFHLLPIAGCFAGSYAAVLSPRATLKECVAKVFTVDADQRIITPDSPLYTDARLGEKIQ